MAVKPACLYAVLDTFLWAQFVDESRILRREFRKTMDFKK